MGRQKYSFEFKKQVVSDYLNGEGGVFIRIYMTNINIE